MAESFAETADDDCQAAIKLAACLVLESKGISLPLPCQELKEIREVSIFKIQTKYYVMNLLDL